MHFGSLPVCILISRALSLAALPRSMDINRLNARSTGTNWTFGIVQHWVNGGAGGSGNSSRVLCMVAGG